MGRKERRVPPRTVITIQRFSLAKMLTHKPCERREQRQRQGSQGQGKGTPQNSGEFLFTVVCRHSQRDDDGHGSFPLLSRVGLGQFLVGAVSGDKKQPEQHFIKI